MSQLVTLVSCLTPDSIWTLAPRSACDNWPYTHENASSPELTIETEGCTSIRYSHETSLLNRKHIKSRKDICESHGLYARLRRQRLAQEENCRKQLVQTEDKLLWNRKVRSSQ